MNVALRTLHRRLAAAGEPAAVWTRLRAQIEEGGTGPVDAGRVARLAAAIGARGAVPDWRRDLKLLGVVGGDGCWEEDLAAAVGTALELVGDSFDVAAPYATWAPVATLPRPLHHILRPPAMRQTAGVLLELVDAAVEDVLLASPFVDQPAVRALTESVTQARRRGVDVLVVTSPGRGAEFAQLAGLGTERGSLRVVGVRTEVSPLGSHAKVLVADGRRAYVGSANLTAAGLDRNIEIGVEVEGPQVAELTRLLLGLARLGTPVHPSVASR